MLINTLSPNCAVSLAVKSISKQEISWIQHANCGEKELVILSFGRPSGTQGGVHVYNIKTKELEWSVQGRLPGMKKFMKAQGLTVNDRGHLFVCDDNNNCVHMFHVVNGKNLGVLIKAGERGVGDPIRIKWCGKRSSFVIIHWKNGKWWISEYKVHVNPSMI